MTDDPSEPLEELEREGDDPAPVGPSHRSRTKAERDAERQADVHSGRAFEWQIGQDAYERWLNSLGP